MKIAAALCWFDEPPETLRRCVSSLAGVADVVVALDGRWKVYPGPANISLLEQAEAIHEAAAAIGIPVVDESCRATQPWPSQIEKRAALMRLAAEHGHWTFVVDADEYVAEASSVELRAALQDTACDVAEVAIAATGRGVFDARPHPRRRIYRSSAAVGLERGHNGYRAADGRWLNGDPRHVDLDPAANLSDVVRLIHDREGRSPARLANADAYYRLRPKIEEEWAAA